MKNFKSGKYKSQKNSSKVYKSFNPSDINRKWVIDSAILNNLHSQAMREIGKLDAYSEIVEDVDFFISSHMAMESVKSSKIEGTRTEFDEAFMDENTIAKDRISDWKEIQNYINSMKYSISKLEKLPLSLKLFNETHKILMTDVRGGTEKKTPGEIRESQNWIGGRSLDDADYIPPNDKDLPDLIRDLEKFIDNDKTSLPKILKIALTHYQFETIHPYSDGNGRIGRLIITLQFIKEGLLKEPTLYLSDFFEKNRTEYYNLLTKVREEDNLEKWFEFFLNGVIRTSKKSCETFSRIFHLKKKCELKISNLKHRSKNAHELMKEMYKKPVMNVNNVAEILNTSHQTATAMVRELEELGILYEITENKRNRLYYFRDYLDIFIKKLI